MLFLKLMRVITSGIAPLLLSLFLLAACGNNDTQSEDTEDSGVPAPLMLNYQLVNEFKHDTGSFTEGLNFYNGQLYESTGAPESPPNNGNWIGPINLQTGAFTKKATLDSTFFGEGITFLNDKVYQLTLKNQKGFVYDAKTFKKLREFPFKGEGWGMTTDGKYLIASSGNSNLYYLDPDSLTFVKMLGVQDNNGFVSDLNELEYIDGFIYANIWLKSQIVKIDPATGYVVGKMDLSKVMQDVKQKYPDAVEMNGIAHDTTTRKTYITGKKWPVIYEIKW
jgi:glutamine cyclotransferase